jgi:TonB family protein
MMGTFFVYMLKSAVCLIAFYLFYRLLLSRETFHRFNRFALLGLLLLSSLVPLCHVTLRQANALSQQWTTWEDELLLAALQPDAAVTDAAPASGASSTIALCVLIVYFAGILVIALRQAMGWTSMLRLIRRGRKVRNDDGTVTVVHDEALSPFSWMRYIVLSEKDYAENSAAILTHERAHIRLRHSIDLMLADACILLQWFNPATWLVKRELQQVHEFEADDEVLRQGINARNYQMLLIEKAVGTRLYSMANSLNQSSLKKRITMMLKKKSNPWARAKYLFVLPLTAAAMTVFARPEITEVLRPISSAKVTNSSEYLQEDSVVTVVDVLPEYADGGIPGFMKYLMYEVKYPEKALKEGTEGIVVVQFTVTKAGEVKDPYVVRGISPELDAEALRVVGLSPKWKPGSVKGEPVDARYTIPVKFKLSNGPKDEEKK